MPDLFEMEREVEITREMAPWAPEEELGVYTVKRWTWFKKQQAVIKSTVVIDSELGKVESDLAEYYAWMIYLSVVPPEGIKWSIDRVKQLDPNVGSALVPACREINGLVWEEKAPFLGPSDPGKATPG